MEEFMRKQMIRYDELNIVYHSINLTPTGYDKNYEKRIKKTPSNMPAYANIKLEKYFNENMNSLMIPTGENYNLILIDIDNKYDTIDKFNELCKDNDFDRETLTEKTINEGYHYYFKLSRKQRNELVNFKSKDGKLFNLHIDVKYTNQFSLGASYIEYNKKIYKTEIINFAYPVTLPDFIFDEIIKVSKPEIKQEIKQEIKPEKKEIKQPIDYDEIKMILNKLPLNYSTDFELWRNVGWSLGSTKDKQLKELYYIFSSKSPKYEGTTDCDRIFDAANGDITLSTLYKYAKDVGIEINNKCIDEIETEYKQFEHYIDFFNHYDSNQFKYIDKFVIEMTKYIKYAVTKSIYIVTIGLNEFDFMKQKAFESAISKYKYKSVVYVDGKKKIKTISMMQLINDNIKHFTVHDIIFKPNSNDTKAFNLFKGFKSKKIDFDMKKIEPVLNHIKEVWANDNKTVYDYIINWFASIIQKPEQKTGVALVFISNEGAGKNIIFDWLKERIFGQYAVNVADIDKIVGKFNNTLSYKLLTLLNEANQVDGNYNKAWDLMKNLITENKQIVEKKGVDPFEIDDYNNYLFFSNNSNPVKISGRDRRYMINTCSNKYVGNKKYFIELSDLLNQELADHLFSYLLQYKCFSLRDIPNTDARTEQKINSLSAVNKWLYHKAFDIVETTEDIKMSSEQIYNIYKEHCEKEGFIKLSIINFTKDLKKVIEQKVTKNKERKSVRLFIFDIQQIKKYFKDEFDIILND